MAAAAAAAAADDDDNEWRSDYDNVFNMKLAGSKRNDSSKESSPTLREDGEVRTPGSRPSQSAAQSRLELDLMREMSAKIQIRDMLTDTGEGILEALWFKAVVTILIIINAIVMGIEVDHPEAKDVWTVIDHFLAAAFAIEMAIKLVILRFAYFTDRWNWLDGALAVLAMMDTWCITLFKTQDESGLSELTVLRVLRLVRLARLARLFRSLNRLVIVLKSILDAFEGTAWVCCVLGCCIYVGAIFCVQYIGRTDKELYPGYSELDAEINEQEVMMNFNPYLAFGSLGAAMVTLFGVAIGAEWTEIVRPIYHKQPQLLFFLVPFCVFVCFGVMNVIIGMIVDSVIQNQRAMQKEIEQAKKNEKFAILDQLKEAIWKLDADGDMNVDFDELDKFWNGTEPELTKLISKLNLPYGCTSEEFFAMLDNNGDGDLDHDEFLTSLYRLMNCGPFQQTCLLKMGINEVKSIIRTTHKELEDRVEEMATVLGLPPKPKKTESNQSEINRDDSKATADPIVDKTDDLIEEDSPVSLVRPPKAGAARDEVSNSEQNSDGHVSGAPSKSAMQASTFTQFDRSIGVMCDQVSAALKQKVHVELSQRLHEILRSCRAEDLQQFCGRGKWEQLKDNTGGHQAPGTTINVKAMTDAGVVLTHSPDHSNTEDSSAVNQHPSCVGLRSNDEYTTVHEDWEHPMGVPISEKHKADHPIEQQPSEGSISRLLSGRSGERSNEADRS